MQWMKIMQSFTLRSLNDVQYRGKVFRIESECNVIILKGHALREIYAYPLKKVVMTFVSVSNYTTALPQKVRSVWKIKSNKPKAENWSPCCIFLNSLAIFIFLMKIANIEIIGLAVPILRWAMKRFIAEDIFKMFQWLVTKTLYLKWIKIDLNETTEVCSIDQFIYFLCMFQVYR